MKRQKYLIKMYNNVRKDRLNIYMDSYLPVDIFKLLINNIRIHNIKGNCTLYDTAENFDDYEISIILPENNDFLPCILNLKNNSLHYYKSVDESLIKDINYFLREDDDESLIYYNPNIYTKFIKSLTEYRDKNNVVHPIISELCMCLNNGTIKELPYESGCMYTIPTLSVLLSESIIHDTSFCGNIETSKCLTKTDLCDFAMNYIDEVEAYAEYLKCMVEYIKSLDRSNL